MAYREVMGGVMMRRSFSVFGRARDGHEVIRLRAWIAQLCSRDEKHRDVDAGAVLRLMAELDRFVPRSALPVTAYLAGRAVGRGASTDQVIRELSDQSAFWRDAGAIDWRD